MIRVTIEADHYDGRIEIVRDDTLASVATEGPVVVLRKLIGAAEASAVAALAARSTR